MYNFSFFIFLFRYPYSLYNIYATSVSISYPIYIRSVCTVCMPFSCICPFMCMPTLYVYCACSHHMYVFFVCMLLCIIILSCVRSLRVYVPHMCMSLHVHVPSVRMSAPFLCPLRGYVSLRVYVGIVVPFRVCSFGEIVSHDTRDRDSPRSNHERNPSRYSPHCIHRERHRYSAAKLA